MSFEHRPGSVVIVLGADFKPAGEVEVHLYLENEKAYKVWWTYQQTGERVMLKVPEWRLMKKNRKQMFDQ